MKRLSAKKWTWIVGSTRPLALAGIAGLAGLAGCSESAVAQEETCALRTAGAVQLARAMERERPSAIVRALEALRQTPAFAVDLSTGPGRRPRRASYAIQYSERRLRRRAQSIVAADARAGWWRALARDDRRPTRSPGEIGDRIRNLVALAEGFPESADAAAQTVGQLVDVATGLSQRLDFPAAPFALGVRSQGAQPVAWPMLFAPPSQLVRTCPALAQSTSGGWLVTNDVPEVHYRATSRLGVGMIAAARAMRTRGALPWAREASAWFSRQALVPDIAANAAAAGLDAEIYVLTAEQRYLERAFARVRLGVLPAFGRADKPVIIDRLPLADVATIAEGLVRVATALAAAPHETDAPNARDVQIGAAVNNALRRLEARAHRNRRLQMPAALIELSLDLERAQRAGAPIELAEPTLLRHALAHGVDRLSRGVRLAGAAEGRLLARLRDRAWGGLHRRPAPPKPTTSRGATGAPAVTGAASGAGNASARGAPGDPSSAGATD
ncbi:MAG: hypothetical protein AAFQ42_00090 [Pseudomonadota bacterium]